MFLSCNKMKNNILCYIYLTVKIRGGKKIETLFVLSII